MSATNTAPALADGWHDVNTAGMPPCDSETLFIGENDNGWAGVFNEAGPAPDDVCYYATAEGRDPILSGLRYWKRYSSPRAALAQQPASGAQPPALSDADAVPDEYRNSAFGYRAGWNDCRKGMQAAAPAAAQPQPLTNEQIAAAFDAAGIRTQRLGHAITREILWTTAGSKDVVSIVRAIEAAHGIGAAAPAGEQP